MKITNTSTYESPEIRVAYITIAGLLCLSGGNIGNMDIDEEDGGEIFG